jgi:hypothetical protein
VARGPERAAALPRLDHHHRPREPADEPVAERELRRARRRARRELGREGAARGEAESEPRVRSRVDALQSSGGASESRRSRSG